jgi:hypothetical protein
MSQYEQARKQSLASVWVARPVPIESQGDVESVHERIMAGRAFLKVVEYPWGIEFDVCDAEGRR